MPQEQTLFSCEWCGVTLPASRLITRYLRAGLGLPIAIDLCEPCAVPLRIVRWWDVVLASTG